MNQKIKNVLFLSAIAGLLMAVIASVFATPLFLLLGGFTSATGIELEVMIFALVWLLGAAIFAIVGIVLVSIPRSWGIILAIGLLLVGLLLFQPELDIAAVLGLLVVFMPRDRRLLGAHR